MWKYYPIYVDLLNKPVLVVGGGTVAYRRVKTLLDYGAMAKATDGEVLGLIKSGQVDEAKGVVERCFRSLLA